MGLAGNCLIVLSPLCTLWILMQSMVTAAALQSSIVVLEVMLHEKQSNRRSLKLEEICHSSNLGLYWPHKVIEQSVAFLSSGISHTIHTLLLVQKGKASRQEHTRPGPNWILLQLL